MSDRAVRAGLAFASLAALCGFVAALIFSPMVVHDRLSDGMAGVILALLGGLVKDAYTYSFGTTANSTARQEVMMKVATNGTPVPPTTPSP